MPRPVDSGVMLLIDLIDQINRSIFAHGPESD
jgi:hypothetical protein